MYAELIFPIPARQSFTYAVPAKLRDKIKFGKRALAPFGSRTLTGYVVKISDKHSLDESTRIKDLIDLIDEIPVIDKKSYQFYKWIADYYLSSVGEALRLADPYGTEVQSKKTITCDPEYCRELLEKEKNKSSTRAKILGILAENDTISLNRLQKILNRKNLLSNLKTLEKKGVLTIHTELSKPKVREKTRKYVKLAKPRAEIYEWIPEIERRSIKQVNLLLKLLSSKSKQARLSSLVNDENIPHSSVRSLEEKGLITVFDKHIERKYSETYREDDIEITLNTDQQKAVDSVNESVDKEEFKTFLLYGVTGSGKTQVYIELIKKVLAAGKTAILLVPEISLTPQITARLMRAFGDEVSVLHSRMSIGERYDSWQRILQGKSRVATGPRSALFAPLKNVGLIVVDEEHDSSYKQSDLTPRYQARDAAIMKGAMYNCPVLLGSATPSVESMYNAKAGKYELLELPERVDNAKLPAIELINVTEEKKTKKMEGIFSDALLNKMKTRFEKGEGVIILQNRRGFATQVYCFSCGQSDMCDDCSVSMVYHVNRNIMQCHYCGATREVPKMCSNCGSQSIKFFGTGTERVEDELEYYFPDVVIKRIDSDSISKKGSLGRLLNKFREGEIDILVGTQMVSKGLDLSRVTLVGVIAAETSLWMPDFRADERTFQLLTQVSGRAGRKSKEGEVVIQTRNDQSFVLQKVIENDYYGFYKKEIEDRKNRSYPPFVHLCLVETRDEDERKAKGAVTEFYNEILKFRGKVNISPPSYAVIARLKGEYRYHILLKSTKKLDPNGTIIRAAIMYAYDKFMDESKFRDVKLYFDMNPYNML